MSQKWRTFLKLQILEKLNYKISSPKDPDKINSENKVLILDSKST